MRLPFRAKLIGIVAVAAAALVILIAASVAISSRTQGELEKIQQHHLPKLRLGPQLDADFERLRRAFQDGVAAHDADAINATRQIEAQFFRHLDEGAGAVTPGQLAILRSAMDDYYLAAVDVSRRLLAGETGERLVDAMSAMQARQARANDVLNTVTALDPVELTRAFSAARQAEISGGHVRLLVSLACLIGLMSLSWWLGHGVVRSLGLVSQGLRRFGGGDFDQPIPMELGDDELADLARQANQMAASLKQLGQERDQNDWVREALSGLGQELRGELEPGEVASRAVRFLARHLGAPLGALYYLNNDRDLVLMGQYGAAPHAPGAAPKFRLGEGLVGQAALGEELTVVSSPPPDYLLVRSGLGEAAPQAIVLLPLRHLGRARGVLELAFFTPWSARGAAALALVQENLVIALEVALVRIGTRQLLAETQRQAARLKEQEEQLRATNEELEAQQEELRHTNDELVQQATKLELQRTSLERNNRDLAEARERLEQKAAELSTVSAYKSQFLANMSHELRTPLNSMLLLSNLLAENEGTNLTEKQVEWAKTVHTAGKDLLLLINQVLDLAKIEAGKRDVNVVPVPIREVAERARLIFTPLTQDKGLRLVVEIAGDVPELVHTDGHRLEQILRNLLGNAIKFTETGEVKLRIARAAATTRFRRGDLRGPDAITFAISDTGVGIAAENQERIFAPFEQVDGTTDRRYGGTGLGLSISRELANLLGGELQMESTLGKGSTFRLHLPLFLATAPVVAPAPPLSAPAESPARPVIDDDRLRLTGKTILIADDDMRTVYALSATLRAKGVEVLVAENGRAALETIDHRSDVDAVLMDIMMPEMDGYEATRRIRQNPQLRNLPIIALTAKVMKGDPEKCLEAGATAYLSKPIDGDRLLALLHGLWAEELGPAS